MATITIPDGRLANAARVAAEMQLARDAYIRALQERAPEQELIDKRGRLSMLETQCATELKIVLVYAAPAAAAEARADGGEAS